MSLGNDDFAMFHHQRVLFTFKPYPAEAPVQKDMFRIGDRMIEPEMPGLGIDIDEKLVGAQEWKFWEAPHWRRRDGSVQNW